MVDRSTNFHPKVFVFHKKGGKSLAWVGSANFTGGGFGHNEEVVLETDGTTRIAEWFERRWKGCGRLDRKLLRRYCEDWKPPAPDFDERPRASEEPAARQSVDMVRRAAPMFAEFLEAISAWRDKHPEAPFEEAIYHPAILLVLHGMGGHGSRREVLDAVHAILKPALRSADRREARPSRVWKNRVDHARANYLVPKGFIQPMAETERGRWVLTQKGQDCVAQGDFGDSWRRVADGLAT